MIHSVLNERYLGVMRMYMGWSMAGRAEVWHKASQPPSPNFDRAHLYTYSPNQVA